MKKVTLFFYLFFYQYISSQIIVDEKFTLGNEVKETSGLLVINNKIITHNDSGDNPNLYELNATTGAIERIITISNATHIDWEDIDEDETHIYIADIGNNNGNRQNLKIYKISKTDFENSNSCTAEIINLHYEDQSDFSFLPNSNNFDAEAIVVLNNQLLIFSKNWQNLQTKVYSIPKTAGNYTATIISSANVEGLITGATKIINNPNQFYLCGYSSALEPFLIFIDSTPNTAAIFSNGFTKISLLTEIGQGSQIEGIISFDNGKLYLSRERFTNTVFGNVITIDAKLFEITETNATPLSINYFDNQFFTITNPVSDFLKINSKNKIESLSIYNVFGSKVFESQYNSNIDISFLKSGMYFVNIKLSEQKIKSTKFIKL